MKTALFKFALVGFLLLTSGLFPNPAHSLIDSGEVPAGWAVWSSWYWPWHDSYNPNLYDPGEAMERYDDYDIGANAQSWEYQYHGPPQTPDTWRGHCHAWSGASVWEAQPTTSKTVGGILFRVRDRKGLMIETYDECANGSNYELYVDNPSPGLFWRYLRDEIRGDDPMHGHGMAFVGELYYGSEVWNYPIYGFEVNYSSSYPYSGTMTIRFSHDGDPSYADSTTLYYGTYTYQFSGVYSDGVNPTDSGTWIGSGPYHRPDAIWRPIYPTTWMQYTSNTELDETHLSNILSEGAPPPIFDDLLPGHWAYDYVMAIYYAGITSGCGTGLYCPGNNVTREQMAAFLVRAVEGGQFYEGQCTGPSPFTDVPQTSPFCRNIERLVALQITGGCGTGMYCPGNNVTREQMAAFLVRAMEGGQFYEGQCTGPSTFTDVPQTSTFCRNIERLVGLGVTQGCQTGMYCPSNHVLRDQMAAFLARAFLGIP